MKLKKGPKIILVISLIILIGLLSLCVYKAFFEEKEAEETKVIAQIDDYGYTLKDNKSEHYKKLFYELTDLLKEKDFKEEDYAKKVVEMYIYDFYSLSDKVSKNDIGGVDFIHPQVLGNFLENAESTYYKYVETNIYGARNQSLPQVDKDITIESCEQGDFKYTDTEGKEVVDDKAYAVTVKWDYTTGEFSDYQKESVVKLVHIDKKLYIVESK